MEIKEQLRNLYSYNGECASHICCSQCIVQFFCDGNIDDKTKEKFEFARFMLNKFKEE